MISWVMDKNWLVRSERHWPWATEPQSVLVLLEICPRCNKISSSCTWHITLTRIGYVKGHSVLGLWPPTFYHQHQGIKILLAFTTKPCYYQLQLFRIFLWGFGLSVYWFRICQISENYIQLRGKQLLTHKLRCKWELKQQQNASATTQRFHINV